MKKPRKTKQRKMNVNKREMTKFIVEALKGQSELFDLIYSICKHCWPEHAKSILHSIEEDFDSGREYNGCMQGIEYHLKACLPKPCFNDEQEQNKGK